MPNHRPSGVAQIQTVLGWNWLPKPVQNPQPRMPQSSAETIHLVRGGTSVGDSV
jgi:hypothetical protein